MRQLFMNQMNSGKKDKLLIKERRGDQLYTMVMGDSEEDILFSVIDSDEKNVVDVKQKKAEPLSEIVVQSEDKPLFLIETENNPEELRVIPTNFELRINGNLRSMHFDVMLGYRKVGKVRKRWVSTEDVYELTIFEPDCESDLIGLVSALDFIINGNEKARKNG